MRLSNLHNLVVCLSSNEGCDNTPPFQKWFQRRRRKASKRWIHYSVRVSRLEAWYTTFAGAIHTTSATWRTPWICSASPLSSLFILLLCHLLSPLEACWVNQNHLLQYQDKGSIGWWSELPAVFLPHRRENWGPDGCDWAHRFNCHSWGHFLPVCWSASSHHWFLWTFTGFWRSLLQGAHQNLYCTLYAARHHRPGL